MSIRVIIKHATHCFPYLLMIGMTACQSEKEGGSNTVLIMSWFSNKPESLVLISDLQEGAFVWSAVNFLRALDQLFGRVQCLAALQQLAVQTLQLAVLLLVQRRCSRLVSLRERLQDLVIVLLQVLLLTPKVLLKHTQCVKTSPERVRDASDDARVHGPPQ